jgi:putative ABC transport system permease protein
MLIALVIASPLAWLALNNWLQNYAYKVSISWGLMTIRHPQSIIDHRP